MDKQRIMWLDFAKFLIMFLVIFEHLGLRDSIISDFIWSFHLPAFFFISGFFINADSKFPIYIRKNVYRLLLPVLLWHIILMVLWEPILCYMMHKAGLTGNLDPIDYYISLQKDFFTGKSCGFSWFMICLFWIKLFDWFIAKIKGGRLLASVILPVISYFIKDYFIITYYVLNALMAYPFLYIGHLLKNSILSLQNITNNKVLHVLLILLTLITSLILLGVNGRGSLNSLDFGKYPLLLYVQGILGAGLVCLISIFVCSQKKFGKVVSVLGGGTVVMLLVQPPFIFISKFIYKQLFHPIIPAPYFDCLSALLFASIIVVMMYPIILIVNIKYPILNGIKKK